MSKTLMTILIALAAACGGSKPTTTGTGTGTGTGTDKAMPSSGGDSQAACVEVMNKNRECTTDYIPALVDVRAKHDNPEGVAAAVKADRDKVVSQALAEWATDSKDDAIARQCEKMAPSMPDADVATAKGCLATAECPAYVACVMPLFEKHITK